VCRLSGDSLRTRLLRAQCTFLGFVKEITMADKKPPITTTGAKPETPVKWADDRVMQCLSSVSQDAHIGRHTKTGSNEPGRGWAPPRDRAIPLFLLLKGGFPHP
jgi:hypothetical protein